MNICFVIDNIFPSHGGVGKTTEQFIKLLSQKGHKITTISSIDSVNKKQFEEIKETKIYRLKGMKVPFTKGTYYQAIPSKSKVIKILKEEKIDIVVLVSYTVLGVKIEKICSKLNIPLALWVHFQPENITKQIHMDVEFIRKIISQWIVFLTKNTSAVIVPTKFAKDLLIKYGAKKKIDIISNGIDLEKYNKGKIKKGLFKEKFGLNDDFIFLYVGRLMLEKNVEMLIKSFSLINNKNNFKLVIVGEGSHGSNLKETIKKLKIEKQVIFTGWVDDETKMQAYNDSDVFILPSLVELEGIVILEAMSYGKPILVSNSKDSAARFFVEKGVNGFLFDPKNHKKLAEKMVLMSKNKDILIKMGKQSLKQVKKYDIHKCIKNMEKILKKCIDEKKVNKKKNPKCSII